MNKILPIILVVVLSGCAATTNKLSVQTFIKVNKFPKLEQIQKAGTGDILVNNSTKEVSKGVTIKDDIIEEVLGGSFRYLAGDYTQYVEHENNTCYGPVPTIETSSFFSVSFERSRDGPAFCIGKLNETYLIFPSGLLAGGLVTEVKADFELHDIESKLKNNNFIRQLIYIGKEESNVKFIFKQASNNDEIPSYQMEVEHDLNKSNSFQLKGLDLQIIESDSNSIVYKVLNNFSIKDFE